jgi:hypothetical protein
VRKLLSVAIVATGLTLAMTGFGPGDDQGENCDEQGDSNSQGACPTATLPRPSATCPPGLICPTPPAVTPFPKPSEKPSVPVLP